jgi:septal ring factor EnvC (AmiA/AmiB activator)
VLLPKRKPVGQFDRGGKENWRIAMTRVIGGVACVFAMCVVTLYGRSILDRIDTTINHLGMANQQLQIANTQLAVANKRLADMQSQLGEANQRLDATEGHVKNANVQLHEAMTALTQTNAKMSAMNAKLGFIDRVFGNTPLSARQIGQSVSER